MVTSKADPRGDKDSNTLDCDAGRDNRRRDNLALTGNFTKDYLVAAGDNQKDYYERRIDYQLVTDSVVLDPNEVERMLRSRQPEPVGANFITGLRNALLLGAFIWAIFFFALSQ